MLRHLTLPAVVALCALLGAPALAGQPRHHPRGHHHQAGPAYGPSFRVSLGLFTPDGDSEFWQDNELEFTGDADDLEDASFTAEALLPTSSHVSVLLSAGYFEGSTLQASREFVDPSGFDIVHETRLQIAPLTLGVLLYPAGRRGTVSPYLGAGAGFYFWSYEEVGDFVLFDSAGDPVDIVFDHFDADGIAPGLFLVGGVDIPLSPGFSLFAEGRWHEVDDDQDDDFSGLGEIDLSGRDLRAGLSWRF